MPGSYKKISHIPDEILSGNRFGLAMKRWLRKGAQKGKSTYLLDKKNVIEKLVDAGYSFFKDPPSSAVDQAPTN